MRSSATHPGLTPWATSYRPPGSGKDAASNLERSAAGPFQRRRFPRPRSGMRSLTGSLLLALLLLAACHAERRDAGLEPVPVPARLDEVDPPVRAQYEKVRAGLDDALASGEATDAELASAYGRLGMWHHAYGDEELARLAYAHASALAPAEDRWLYYLGVVSGELGATEAAQGALGRYLERRGDEAPALVRLAEIELAAGRAGEAKPHLEAALAADPESPRALAMLGRLALAARDHEAAARHLEAALALAPDAAKVHYSLGLAYRGLGERERAARHMARGGADNRQKADAPLADPLMAEIWALKRGSRSHSRHGRQAFYGGDYERAVAASRQAVEADPDEPAGRLNLGAALLRSGRAEEAVAEFEETLRLSPGHPAAHFSLGAAFNTLGRPTRAREHYRAAVAANPGYMKARYNLANLLRKDGDFAAALAHYERVIELDPGLAHARLFRAVSLTGLGRWREADSALGRDLAELAGNRLLRTLAARLPATAGDAAVRDGRRALELALALHRQAPTLMSVEAVAAAHAELSDYARARAWQEAALAAARDVAGGRTLARLSRRLALYHQDRPCREVWADDELYGLSVPAEGP